MIEKLSKSKIIILMLMTVIMIVFTDTGYAQRLTTIDSSSRQGTSSQMSSALWSTLFPGIGQLKNNEKSKAYIFMGVGGALLGTTLYMGLSQNNLWKDYVNSETKSDYDSYKSRVQTANIFIGITSAFWIYNVVDAYLGAKKSSLDRDTKRKKTRYPMPVEEKIEEEDSAQSQPVEYIICPKCKAEIQKGAKFCPKCGAKIVQKEKGIITCPKCKAKIKKGAKFCPECGAQLK